VTPQGLAQVAQALFPPGVTVAGAAPCDPVGLHPEERPGIARAVPARQREFAGGRRAAALAQAALGLGPRLVPMGLDRAPVWPQGLRGTITHHGGLCLAAVTAGPWDLGLDLEPDAPLPPEALAEVLHPCDRGDPRAVFSAKEAVYKALYPRVRAVFGFDAVRVVIADAGFTATMLHPLGPVPEGSVLNGRLARVDGLILTALAYPLAGSAG